MSKAFGYGLLNAKYNTLQQLVLSNQGGGGGGSQDLQSVLDEGNTATDIAILFNQTANSAITSGMNSQSIALNSNNLTSTNQRSLALSTSEVEMFNSPGPQETETATINPTQFKLKFNAGRFDPKPSPEAIYGLNKMSLNDGSLTNDNKTIEVEPTGITISEFDNSVLTNSIEITPKTIAINNAYGTAGQVLTSGGSAGTLSWANSGTPNLQEVLDEGNTAQDIAINLTNSFSPTTQAIFSSNGVSSLSNTTNSLEATLTSSEIRIVKNTTSTSDEDRTTLIPSQLKMRLIPRFPDITPAKEAIYDIDKVLIDDKALNGDNKTIEMKPTGITMSQFDNNVLTNEIIMDNEGFSVENITTGKVAYINLTAGLSLPPSSAITLENTAGANGYVITSNGTTASWQPSSGGGGWVGTATSNLDMVTHDITSSTGTLNLDATDIDITGQATFNSPPHLPPPVQGIDGATKGYVDSLVGQYSGGLNLFLNYSQTSGDFPTYKVLSKTISSDVGQTVDITFTSGTQEVARFISEPLGITELPTGLFDAFIYGSVSGQGGDVHYTFQLNKVTSAGVSTPIVTSGISPDVNASPNNNPTSYSMIAPITAPVALALTDRLAFILSVTKTNGGEVLLRTFFEGSYYSFVQSTLNAGTTLLSSNNNWTGTNNFEINPTTPSKTSPANTDIINYADIQRLSTPIVSTLDYYITTDSPFFQYPPAPPTNTLLNTYQYYGWYFINAVIARKISWYFAPDYAMTVADVKGLYMNYFNITTTSNDNLPFISIYTKPTGTNDVIPGFAHSVNTFIPTFTPIATTPFCSFMNISGTQQDPFPYGHILGAMAQSTVNNPRGEYLSTEEVLAVAVGTASGSALNQVAFIMSKVGICLEQGNQELILNPQNIIVPPNLTQTLTSGNSAGGLSISGVNNLSATTITTPTLANGSATLTLGTLGQITNIVGTLQNNGAELPAYISSAGVASGSIDMNSNSITECNNLSATTITTPTLANGASTLTVGTLGQITNIVGTLQNNGSELPAYISSAGVASGSIDMNSNSITECNSLDSVSSLTLGGTNALGVNVGRSAQTTNLVGNVQINGSSGTSGQALVSTGETTSPTWQPIPSANITFFQSFATTAISMGGVTNIGLPLTFNVPTSTATYLFTCSTSVGPNGSSGAGAQLLFSFTYQVGGGGQTTASRNVIGNNLYTTSLTSATAITQQVVPTGAGINSCVSFQYIYRPGSGTGFVAGNYTFGITVTNAGSGGPLSRSGTITATQLVA